MQGVHRIFYIIIAIVTSGQHRKQSFLHLLTCSSATFVLRKNIVTLTPHHPDEEVKLFHGVAEGGDDEPQTGQTTTNNDDRTTSKFVDQDAANWTWKPEGTANQLTAQCNTPAVDYYNTLV